MTMTRSGPTTTDEQRAVELLRTLLYNRRDAFRPYAKQLEFFAQSTTKRQRMFNAGNRLGKSDAGAFEMQCHLTGEYPDWWPGRRYTRPISAWACGLSADATMKISQGKLCGDATKSNSLGTGLIPKDKFVNTTLGRGITGAYASVEVRHVSGGTSSCSFKSYEQGWQKFQGDKIDVIWLDEEPEDYRIYNECRTRTLDTGGLVYITYTPLLGETELYNSFHDGKDPNKGFVNMTGDDVLAEPNNHFLTLAKIDGYPDTPQGAREWYENEIRSFPRHEQATRREGRPTHGSGAVFDFLPHEIMYRGQMSNSGFVRMGWGVDFGGMGQTSGNFSHPFGAAFGLYDSVNDTIYVERCVRLPGGMILQHADAMKRVCAAAPVFWPHDGNRQAAADSPETTSGLYKAQGLRMWHQWSTFQHGGYQTEAGIIEMHQRFQTGRLKIHEDLADWFEEYRNYHRDDHGEIVKIKDDLMSATRILVMMLPRFGKQVPMGNNAGRHWKDVVRGLHEPQKSTTEWDPITGRPY